MTAVTVPSATGVPAYSESLPRVASSVGIARRLVTSSLRVWGLEDMQDVAWLVMSELVTNAVRHARLDCVRVTVSRTEEDTVRLAVVDRSFQQPEQRAASLDDEHGRGLDLVDALAESWAVDPLRWGKRVWADVRRVDS